MNKQKLTEFFKSKKGLCIVVAIVCLILGGSIEKSNTDKRIKDIENKYNSQIDLLNKKNEELNSKLDEAKPWFEMSDAQKKAKEEELKKQKEAEEKAAAEKAAAEKKAKEEEEKKGYDTGVTYENLARTPDDYLGKKVKFSGKVVQVMEDDDETQIRLAVNDNYDNILYLGVPKTLTGNNRILENDEITIMGKSAGLLTYKSTMGGNITIPSVLVDKFE
ncbi:toxin regulator [Clostridium sp. LIBA-8841]|uniref:toxin regulator n=1 Tax=Clostridium sp. LIBA-8841 TaxID=2987530 RepID=UPI002AC4F4D8|nr:toxin regulator [Clostridium sp. LIBA-8841]MDZ5255120.1 toxin regulator [Clostridium sp. LIBA-8841]